MTGRRAASRKHGAPRRGRAAHVVEGILWGCAAACLVPVLAATAARAYLGQMTPTMDMSTPAITTAAAPTQGAPAVANATTAVASPEDLRVQGPAAELVSDWKGWSPQRLSAFEQLGITILPPMLGRLELPRQGSRIPVFDGVSELSMTLGAGHIPGTAPLEGAGNIALTAHRDGTFRVLKDVAIGDTVVLGGKEQSRVFQVTDIQIVTPDQVEVLDPTPHTTLTLVTCYPFYYVGNAPQRYVVRAELQSSGQVMAGGQAGARGEPGSTSPSPTRT